VTEFILLDDCSSTEKLPTSRLYKNPHLKFQADSVHEINNTLDAIQEASKSGLYVVVMFSYEMGEYLQNIIPKDINIPYILAYAFKDVNKLSAAEVNKFLEEIPDNKSGFVNLKYGITENQFCEDINTIKEHIQNGDCYQINHTFRVHGEYYGDGISLYKRLKNRQPTLFGAYVKLDSYEFLSLSPEWFVSSTDGIAEVRPMKGTLPIKNHNPDELKLDIKNRAENIMIVDLMRNDLGIISEIGSVTVPSLFDINEVGELYQMTSTIQSKLKNDLTFNKLVKSLFPCGSITGAPKNMAMKIIHNLEKDARGLYCGSIGWIDPAAESNNFGNFSMNVAIRTLTLSKHTMQLGIGAGIIYDSEPQSEWKECLLKGRFATSLPSTVGVFETMLAENGVIKNLEKHLTRIKKSINDLNLIATHKQLKNAVLDKIKNITFNKARVKLSVDATNKINVSVSELSSLTVSNKIFWAHQILSKDQSEVCSQDPLLKYKTDNRENYDAAFHRAEELNGFDAIFVNELGQVTEGGRSNIFIKLNGKWLTPSVNCGLLPGIKRSEILEDIDFNAEETVITITDVQKAEEIIVTNSLRGILKVKLELI
jgi:para-aminobenzoate synthetase/4-amino-4-deoxychorismate lyase